MKIFGTRIAAFLLISFTFLLIAVKVGASEGIVELESQTDEPYRCFATSLKMQTQEYRILFSCRYLIYPIDESIFNYVMWATPVDGSKVVRLGVLGLGKGELKTKIPFTTLFVTTESNKNTKTPSGSVVMEGDVKEIEFLGSEPTPTPEPSESDDEEVDVIEEVDVQQLSTREKLVVALKRAGIAALFALVALVGIIFVVSRSRG
jgi:hypothetical protein